VSSRWANIRKRGDLEGEVVGYPGAVQVSRSCYFTMGVPYGMRRVL
jgi:hypothetical protein